MQRFILIFIAIVLLVSCKFREYNKIDAAESLELFEEGSDLMMRGFDLEVSDSLRSQKFYMQAIDKFNAAYTADKTNTELGTYLPDLYFNTQQFDSALVWSLRMFPFDSIMYYKNNPKLISISYIFIAECYLFTADIANANRFFRLALAADSLQALQLAQTLSDAADKFYKGGLPGLEKKLNSKSIDHCKYLFEIMQLGLSVGKSEKYVTERLFNKEKFAERQKNCR